MVGDVAEVGQDDGRQTAGDVADERHAAALESEQRGRQQAAHDEDERAGHLGSQEAQAEDHDQRDDPHDDRRAVSVTEAADPARQLLPAVVARRLRAGDLGELADRRLDARPEEEADDDGLGQEVRDPAHLEHREDDEEDPRHERDRRHHRDRLLARCRGARGRRRRRRPTARRSARSRSGATCRTARTGSCPPPRRRARTGWALPRCRRSPAPSAPRARRRSGRRSGPAAASCADSAAPTRGSAGRGIRRRSSRSLCARPPSQDRSPSREYRTPAPHGAYLMRLPARATHEDRAPSAYIVATELGCAYLGNRTCSPCGDRTAEGVANMADERLKRIAEFIEPLRVRPGSKVTLAKDFDPGYKADFVKKKDGIEILNRGVELLSEYQARLAAQDTHGVLVVLQALDAAGKDGTIRHVMSGVNPQGVSVHSFKVPSSEELDHDYLWRFAKSLPRPRRDRHLQPLLLRGGPRGARTPREPPPTAPAQGRPRQGRLEAPLPRHQRLGALPHRQRLHGRQALPEPLPGGAAHPLPAAHRSPRSQLEVLLGGRQRTRLLGRLSEGLQRDADGDQHRLGAVVRDPRRPQVVRAHLCRGRRRRRPHRHRPPFPQGRRPRSARSSGRSRRSSRSRRPREPPPTRSRARAAEGEAAAKAGDKARRRTRRANEGEEGRGKGKESEEGAQKAEKKDRKEAGGS